MADQTLSPVESFERQLALTKALLKQVGDPGVCRSCNAPIFWVKHMNGKLGIYDPDGASHFATCIHADQHRKRK